MRTDENGAGEPAVNDERRAWAPERAGGDPFDEIFHPVAERVLARCDAVLRIGGASDGADRMVDVARRLGKTVFTSIEDIR